MARILRVSGKCSDLSDSSLEIDGKTVARNDGYVPCINGIGGGDYIEIEIDLDTGKVIGLETNVDEIRNAIREDEDDEDE